MASRARCDRHPLRQLGTVRAASIADDLHGSDPTGRHVTGEVRLQADSEHRTTRRQSLTDLGRLYYERCRVIIAETEAAEALVQDLSTTPRGRLRVSAPVTFGACSLAPAILQFQEDHLGIEVELTLTDRFVDIVDEGYDAVVRLGPIGDTSLAARELAGHALVACASPTYLADRGAPATPEALADHACLGFVNWSGRPYAEWRFTRGDEMHAVQVRSRFQVNDGRVLLAAGLAGHGIHPAA